MQKVLKRFLTGALAVAVCFGFTAVTHTAVEERVVADAATSDSYYNKITATGGTELLGQVHDLIVETHRTYTTYAQCKSNAITTDPGKGSNTVMEFYTQTDINNSNFDKSGGWNREHVWAQSISGGLWGTDGAGSDLHHIRPAEKDLNARRGNMRYGEVGSSGVEQKTGSTNILGGHSVGSNNGGTFEPLDNVKGDVARIIMYVYTHYNNAANVGGTKEASKTRGTLKLTQIVSANTEDAAKQLLLKWNESDPVDKIETTRNDAVYNIQGNRNPFIDHPEYAEAIWGDGSSVTPTPPSNELKSIAFDASAFTLNVGQSRTLTVMPNPSSASASVTWTSSNSSVATVANGKVTAVGAGSATITATSTVNSSIKATATVTVINSTTPTPSDKFEAGTYRIAVSYIDNEIPKKMYFSGSLDGNYGATTTDVNSAAEVVATETADGYTLKVGNKYLELQYYAGSNGNTLARPVLVDTSSREWKYDSELNTLTWMLTTNGQYYYLGTYTNANNGITYSNISASETKRVTGDNVDTIGVTRFIANFENVNAPTVPDKLQSITLDPSAATIKVETGCKLNVLTTPSGMTAEVDWTSSNPSVAFVEDGMVIGIKAGTVTITATCKADPSIKATATVTVIGDTADPEPVDPDEEVELFVTLVEAIDDSGTLLERRVLIYTVLNVYNEMSSGAKAQVTKQYAVLNEALNKLIDDYNAIAEDAELNALGGIV